jgi:PAS domain S-box-containing protein
MSSHNQPSQPATAPATADGAFPAWEHARLARLEAYRVLDTPPEEAFDRITRMVARLLDVPIVLVSLVDAERQWFKSRHGLEATETPRPISFCTHAIRQRDVFTVEDASLDPRFADNPLVCGAPDIRFYAGAPLDAGGGLNLGTLCAIDRKPRRLTPEHKAVLQDFAGIVVDALDHRLAAERAREAESLLGDAVEALPDGFVIYDRQDRLAVCNSRFREIYGLSEADVADGLPFDAMLRRGLDEGRIVEARGAEEAYYDARMRAHRNPGAPFEQAIDEGRWLRITERKTRSGGLVGIRTDITELKRQQQTLESMAHDLQIQLARAEEAARAKTQFLASVSHELRTPLNAVLGFSEVLREEIFGPIGIAKYREYSADIHSSAQHLLSLVDDILDMAKLASGKFALSPEPMALAPSLQEAARIVSIPIASKRLDLDVRCEPAELEIQADVRALRQILFNLLSNATKFTPAGGRVRATASVDPVSGAARIVVADNGPGIPVDVLPHLGQPFQRVGNAMTSSEGGSGLGLAISRAMAEGMGGSLHIDSRVGAGTTVTVTLPLTRQAAAA